MRENANVYPFPDNRNGRRDDGSPETPAPFVADLDQRHAVAGRVPTLDEPTVPDTTSDTDDGLDDFGHRTDDASPDGEEDDGQSVDGDADLSPVDLPGGDPRVTTRTNVSLRGFDVAGLPDFLARLPKPRPVFPLWVANRGQRRAALRWLARYAWHTVKFHAWRLPVKYTPRLAWYALRGTGRATGGWWTWTFDREARPLRLRAVAREDVPAYMALSRQRNERTRNRLLASLAATAGVGVALGAAAVVEPVTVPLAGAFAVGTAAWFGREPDRPFLIDSAVVSTRVARLTSGIVTRALGALGIPAITQALAKGPGALAFVAPITRDGPGWRAELDLPYGVTVDDVMERRDRLASGLRRPLGCVWPEPVHAEHTGRLVLWVGDQDMASATPPAWPLAKHGTADFFAPIPFGTDPRGRTVALVLFENNTLLGALPGAGKTGAVRVVLLAAALDPTVRLWVFENAGKGDLAAAELVAERYASGIDDDTILTTLTALRDLKAEVLARSQALSRVPKDQRPDGKLTRALANRANEYLRPLVAIVDECQNLFAHPKYGKEAGELAEFVIKVGRALGIHLLLATQRPDKDSVPTGVSGNVSLRFCLRVMGHHENDMVLGTGAHKNGIRATTFTTRDKGMGYLVGAAEEPRIVKTYYLDLTAAETIARRARALREAAGTLTGHAIGDTAATDTTRRDTLLDDVLAVTTGDEPKVWSELVVERLAELRPGVYGGWRPEQLSAALKPHGVKTVQVWGTTPDGTGANRRGIERAAVLAALHPTHPKGARP